MGLEVVVRPVVLPNIRPSAPRVLAPADNPDSGIAVISGGGGMFLGTSHSSSFSISSQTPHQETKRQVDVLRVYQKSDDAGASTRSAGTINRENYVDVEQMKKVSATNKTGDVLKILYQEVKQPDNVEVRESNKTVEAGGG
jgi:hypothetical protein